MATYLTGLLIDCTAILAVAGYYLYYVIKKREPEEPRYYFTIVIVSIVLVIAVSTYFFCTGDLTTAGILAWLMAVPVLVTSLFILMIIIFRPNWN